MNLRLIILLSIAGLTTSVSSNRHLNDYIFRGSPSYWDHFIKGQSKPVGGFLFLSTSDVIWYDYDGDKRVLHSEPCIHRDDTLSYTIDGYSLLINDFHFTVDDYKNDSLMLNQHFRGGRSSQEMILFFSKDQKAKIGSHAILETPILIEE